MTDDKKKALIEFAEAHLQDIIEEALHEYGYWDGLIEYGELDQEDWEWMRDNLVVEVGVELK